MISITSYFRLNLTERNADLDHNDLPLIFQNKQNKTTEMDRLLLTFVFRGPNEIYGKYKNVCTV